MMLARRAVTRLYWTSTLTLSAIGVAMALFYAPTEATMGTVQRIFYLHLPAAIGTFLAAGAVFAAGVGYLGSRRPVWDHLALAAARVTVVYCTVVLLTGMMWARLAWGIWWTWSPRLTFSLVLWLLYVASLIVRPAIESPARRALVCAVYGIVAFLDVPLVYLSVKLLPDIHPSSVTLAPEMRHTLLVCTAASVMLCAGLIGALFGASNRGKSNRESGEAVGPHAGATGRSGVGPKPAAARTG